MKKVKTKLKDFVIEITLYKISCSLCVEETNQCESADDAIKEAERGNYEVYPDGVYCGLCLEEILPN